MTDFGDPDLDELEDEPVEEEEAKPLEGVGYSKADLRALRAAVLWLRDEVELFDELDFSSFYKGALVARGVRAELAQDVWLLGMLESEEYEELLNFLEDLDKEVDASSNGVNYPETMGRRWVLPMHLDTEWRLNEQATTNWIGIIEDIEGNQISDMSALASVDFVRAYNMSLDLVEKHNDLVDPRQEVLVNRIAKNKVVEKVDTGFANKWIFSFTDGSRLTIESVENRDGQPVLVAIT